MKNFKLNATIILIIVAILSSCANNSSEKNSNYDNSKYKAKNEISKKDPYEVMHATFEGSPDISELKLMLESVMQTYNFERTNDNRLKIANMLVTLRKESTVGVTEMDILKDIYLNGSDKISLAEQEGLSATILETKNKNK